MGNTIVVNLFGSPSAGKSTTATGLFHQLKLKGINCEYVSEFAKHVVWQENFNTLKNQLYVFAKQHDRMFHLKGKVDVIITDSPLPLSLIYCDFNIVSPSLATLVMDEFNKEDIVNMNYYINRKKKYNPAGRMQTEDEAAKKGEEIIHLLAKYNIKYEVIDGDETIVDKLLNEVLIRIGK